MRDFGRFDGLDNASPDEVAGQQDALLREHIKYIATNSRFYRGLFEKEGVRADDVGLDTLGSLPLTDKLEFDGHNHDFLSVGMAEVSDIVLSSGTTGRPTRIMYSEGDLQRLTYNERVAMQRIGMTPDDIALLTCTIDRCFIAGLAYYSGIRAIGASSVRSGLNSLGSHLEIIRRISPTVIVGVPSFLVKLGKFLAEEGIDPASTDVDKLICIGEPLRDRDLRMLSLGQVLEELWAAKAYSTYASSETITTFCECTHQQGGHLHPALGIVEIVDEEGNVLPHGEVGEIVMTPLQKEAMPLLRFRTGDASFLIDGPCGCGRMMPRLGPILGRKKQMIKSHGTTLYIQAIFSCLDEMQDVVEYYVEVSNGYDLSDLVKVHVAANGPAGIGKRVTERLQDRLRIKPEVVVDSEKDVRGMVYNSKYRKPMRFIDKRKNRNGLY
jgi:phenylacetate-CoA ligase